MSTLFISHSSKDNEWSRKLEQELDAQGHRSVFLDSHPEKGLQAAVSWERSLYTNLRSCRAVLALCSQNYLGSHWCFAEVALARMEGKAIFVLLIDPWDGTTELPSILTEGQFIDLRTDPADGWRRLWHGFESLGLMPEERRQLRAGQCPYPGLRAFDVDDEAIFFGRDDEIRHGVDQLNSARRQNYPRLLMVLGSSGSGKSSLVRAGMLPRLQRDPSNWLVVGPLRPGAQPASELAEAFARAFRATGRPRTVERILRQLDGASASADASHVEKRQGGIAGLEAARRAGLRQALDTLASELGAADPSVHEAVSRLREYFDAWPSTPPSERPSPPTGSSEDPLVALTAELRREAGQPGATVVLVVDQFEELLGHGEGQPRGESSSSGAPAEHPSVRFLALLGAALRAEGRPPLVLGTMRSDFLGQLQTSRSLRGVAFKSQSVGPMSERGMRQVIEGPAVLGQIDLAPELTNLLVKETGTADALPLLAFTLRAMWDRFHAEKRFDETGYDSLGRLRGAIAREADDTLAAAVAAGLQAPGGKDAPTAEGLEQRRAELTKALRASFLSLVRPASGGSGWARQPATWADFAAEARPMMRRFVDRRLLVERQDGTVEVAHEALFQSWTQLSDWLKVSAEGLLLRDELRSEAQRWESAATEAEKEAYLWRRGRLQRALELEDDRLLRLDALGLAFLDASRKAQRRRRDEAEAQRQRELEQARRLAAERARSARRTRIFAAVIGVALVVAISLLMFAIVQRRQAEDQSLVAVAKSWLDRDPTHAALLLLEVRDPERAPLSVQLMSDALRQPLATLELPHPDEVTQAVFDPTGERVLTACKDSRARVWQLYGEQDSAARGDLRSIELLHDDQVLDLAVSADGHQIVTASRDGSLRLWRAEGELIGKWQGSEGEVTSVAFGADGSWIVSGSTDGRVRRWSAALAGGEPSLEFEIVPATETTDPIAAEVTDVAVSGDGRLLATATRNGNVKLWQAATGELHSRLLPGLHTAEGSGLKSHTEAVDRVAFSALPGRLITGSKDGTARIWAFDPGGSDSALSPVESGFAELAHGGFVTGAAFSPDGQWVATSGDDGVARLWQVDGAPLAAANGTGQVRLGHEGEINSVEFDPAGRRLVTASKDGTARLWTVGGGTEPVVLASDRAWRAVFSADDELTLASDQGVFQTYRLQPATPVSRESKAPPRAATEVWAAAGPPTQGILDPPRAVALDLGLSAEDYLFDYQIRGDGRRALAVVTRDFEAYEIRLWAAASESAAWARGPTLVERGEPQGCRAGAQLSRDGRLLLTFGLGERGQSRARLWALDGALGEKSELEPRTTFDHQGACLTHASLAPDGRQVVTVAADGRGSLWRTEGPPTAPVVWREADRVELAIFDPSGRRLVTAAGARARGREAARGTVVGSPMRHDHEVVAMAFDRSGERLATGSRDEVVRLWTADGTELATLRGHQSNVRFVDFSPDGQRLVSVGELVSARVWGVSYEFLGAKILWQTQTCLGPAVRRRALGESESLAQRRAAKCRRCLDQAMAADAQVDPSAAFASYRRCRW